MQTVHWIAWLVKLQPELLKKYPPSIYFVTPRWNEEILKTLDSKISSSEYED